jgi:hypothetical protein
MSGEILVSVLADASENPVCWIGQQCPIHSNSAALVGSTRGRVRSVVQPG